MERWTYVKGYEGLYMISTKGRVRSIFYGKDKELKQHVRGHYKFVVLTKNGKPKNHYIHILVLSSFYCKPKADMVVHHINKVRYDNRLSNLIYMTPQEHRRIHRRI